VHKNTWDSIAVNQYVLEKVYLINSCAEETENVILQTVVFVSLDLPEKNVNSQSVLEEVQMKEMLAQEEESVWDQITVYAQHLDGAEIIVMYPFVIQS
jgi:hypothetical protein